MLDLRSKVSENVSVLHVKQFHILHLLQLMHALIPLKYVNSMLYILKMKTSFDRWSNKSRKKIIKIIELLKSKMMLKKKLSMSRQKESIVAICKILLIMKTKMPLRTKKTRRKEILKWMLMKHNKINKMHSLSNSKTKTKKKNRLKKSKM